MRQRRPHASLSDRPTSRARLTFGLLIVVRPCSKGEQTGFYTGAGSYDYQADHARRCVIVDGSATTLLPVRCCADGREGQSWPVKPTAVRAATPRNQHRMSLTWGCDTLRVQVDAVPAPDQLAVFVAAAPNARPPDSPLLPSWDGSVTIGTTGSLDVTKLLPNTSYSVWSSAHSARGWSNWSAPQRSTTTRPPKVPAPPQAPEMGAATSCDEILLRLPAKADAGCASYESLELEMMVAGRGWQAATYKKRADRTVSVSQLDPLQVVEYRFAAQNLAGRSVGESTGPLPGMGVVSRDGLLNPPTVTATSSQSMHLDWSAMAPLGCSSLLTWQVLHRRNGAAGDAWQVLESSHPHTIYQPVIRCPEGCSFKVLPNLVGWTQPSVASVPVPTPEMPPLPPTPGVRLRLRLLPEVHEVEPFKLASKLLCAELKEALGATGHQVAAVELVDVRTARIQPTHLIWTRAPLLRLYFSPLPPPETLAQGEQFVDAVVDLLPSDEPSSRSPEALAQEMVSQLGESPAQPRPPHIARDGSHSILGRRWRAAKGRRRAVPHGRARRVAHRRERGPSDGAAALCRLGVAVEPGS